MAASHVPLATIFLAFLRLGATAFGGPAMVAYIRELAVAQRSWVAPAAFARGVAICQALPGATAMQVAAFVGLRLRGLPGGCAAYLGFGLPACLLMLALTAGYQQGQHWAGLDALFAGLRAVVVALIAHATVQFARTTLLHWRDWLLAGGAAVALASGLHPLAVVAVAGLVAAWLLRVEPSAAAATPASGRALFRQVGWLVFAAVAGGVVLRAVDQELFDLALTMVRIDLFAFGGGFASVPLMQHEVVVVRQWLDAATFIDGIALGQLTPGPIVITATFIGYLLRGLAGAAVATAGIFLPSLIILSLALPCFDRLERQPLLGRALRGALVAFVGLLAEVTVRFAGELEWRPVSFGLALAAFVALRRGVDILWVVLAAAIVALLLL